MLTLRRTIKMDERFGKAYLNHLEVISLQLESSLSQKEQEKQSEIWDLIDGVKKKLEECLRQRRMENRRRLSESLAREGRQLDKLLETHPSMDLCGPEDFILYWYIHGEFPEDMCPDEIKKTQWAIVDWLDQLIDRDEPDKAYAAYCQAKAEVQLQQLQEMIEFFNRDAFEDEDDTDDSIDWQSEEPDDFFELPYEDGEEAEGSADGWPIYLAFLPEEPEHPEDLTIPELGFEIEKQEYNLLCLKSVENGEEGTEKPFLWQQSVDSVKATLAKLRRLLRQRMLEALGVEAEDSFVPMEYQDSDLPILYGGDEANLPEDIVASWYLSDSFPLISSYEKMQQVEEELKRQEALLEAEEPALEDEEEHALWEFCMDQKAEQLEEIQTMMWNQATDWGELDYEEDPEDE